MINTILLNYNSSSNKKPFHTKMPTVVTLGITMIEFPEIFNMKLA